MLKFRYAVFDILACAFLVADSDDYLVMVTVSVTAGVVATSLLFLAVVLSCRALYSHHKKNLQ